MAGPGDTDDKKPDSEGQPPKLDSDFIAIPVLKAAELEENAQRKLYELAYRELCLLVTGEEPVDPPPPEEEFLERVKGYLSTEPHITYLRLQLCAEFEYCEKMRKTRHFQNFARDALIPLLAIMVHVGFVAVGTIWFGAKSGFDWLCDCD